MAGRKTIEELFTKDSWSDSLTEKNIKRIVNEFYKQVGDERAEKFAESLENYREKCGRSYLREIQEGIKTYALVLLTSGIVGQKVRDSLNPGFAVCLKANQVLSHLESNAMRNGYKNTDYKEELERLSEYWLKRVFEE